MHPAVEPSTKVSLQFLRFCAVGAIGFCIDGGLLWGLLSNGFSHVFGRAISFPVAVITTWWLNRMFTFTNANKACPRSQINRYFALQILGSLANLVVYLTILSVITPSSSNALAALAVGATIGLFINFIGSRKFVFVSNETSNGSKTIQKD